MSMIKVNEDRAKELDNLYKYHVNHALKFNDKVRSSFIKYLQNLPESLPEKADIEIIIKELQTY